MYYFAYGLDLSKKRFLELCPGSQPKFPATLPNYRLVFTGWSRQWHGGLATIKYQRGEKVRGGIYEVSEVCLRRLEKVEPGYGRINITVFDEDNQPVPAVTLIRTGQIQESMPSREYGEVIRQGYRDWGIA